MKSNLYLITTILLCSCSVVQNTKSPLEKLYTKSELQQKIYLPGGFTPGFERATWSQPRSSSGKYQKPISLNIQSLNRKNKNTKVSFYFDNQTEKSLNLNGVLRITGVLGMSTWIIEEVDFTNKIKMNSKSLFSHSTQIRFPVHTGEARIKDILVQVSFFDTNEKRILWSNIVATDMLHLCN